VYKRQGQRIGYNDEVMQADAFWYLNEPAAALASDWHLCLGEPLRVRLNGQIVAVQTDRLITQEDIDALTRAAPLEDDELEIPGAKDTRRFRVHRLMARAKPCAVIRSVPPAPWPLTKIPEIPPAFVQLLEKRRGLILVGGATGSGKSTTVASCLDAINRAGGRVIITLEHPIEYTHRPSHRSVIYQRAFHRDFLDWPEAITSAMREDPDVIYVSEMRDPLTIEAALRASDTGHLVFGTVHGGSPNAMIDRIISTYPASARDTLCAMLANNCIGYLAQDLVENTSGGRSPIFELLLATRAANTTIRDNKLHQLRATIVSGASEGMVTFDKQIERLFAGGRITRDVAREYHSNPDFLK
jgi:twitching motility protein PilT